MILLDAPGRYDPQNEQETRQVLALEDKKNVKKGESVRFGRNEVLIQSPDGSWWAIKVADDGTVSSEIRA